MQLALHLGSFAAAVCAAMAVGQAQPVSQAAGNAWNGRKAAVALTYDDGLNVHLDKVIPALDAMGFKGTFYLIMSRDGVSKRIDDWRAAARRGHELGNHTLSTPAWVWLPAATTRTGFCPSTI